MAYIIMDCVGSIRGVRGPNDGFCAAMFVEKYPYDDPLAQHRQVHYVPKWKMTFSRKS